MKRILALLMGIMMLVSAFAGCSNTANTPSNTDTPSGDNTPANNNGGVTVDENGKRTITIYDSEWLGTNLYRCTGWYGSQDLIADTFFLMDPDDRNKVLPRICEGYEISEDGLTMKLIMSEGMKFYDGTDVTPEDVIASIQYGLDGSDWGYGYSNIESMEADGKDVILHLSTYRTDLMHFLCTCFMGIIKKDCLDTMTDDELQWGAIPYGAFYVDEYIPGDRIILKPNPYYKTNLPLVENKGPVDLDYITVIVADTEAFTQTTMLANGEVDVLTGINMEQYAELQSIDGVITLENTYPNIEYFELNQDHKDLQDINVRKAIMLALDRDAMEEMCNGAMKPAYSMITEGMQFFSEKAEAYFKDNLSNNVEEAKRLLAEAGYTMNGEGYLEKDGSVLEFTFLSRSSGTSVTVAQEMQLQLQEIGIKMNIETIDWNYIYERMADDDYDAGIAVLEWAEAILVLNYAYYDPNTKSDADMQVYKDLVEKAATSSDMDQAVEYVYEAQMEMFKDCAIVPLYSDVSYCAYRNDINGLVVCGDGSLFYNDINYAG